MQYLLNDSGLASRLSRSTWSRRTNVFLEPYNNSWASDVTGIPKGNRKGPDLYVPSEKAIEIKWTWRGPGSKKSQKWTVDYKALRFPELAKQCFWAFGIYDLDVSFSDLRNARTQIELIKHIKYRTLMFVEWPFIETNYIWSHTEGEAKTKEWDTYLCYPKSFELPKTVQSFKVKYGEIQLTRGVNVAVFPNLRGVICGNALC